MPTDSSSTLRLAVPKGRIEEGVVTLLGDAGMTITRGGRSYRPHISIPDYEVKLLKPQNVVEMLAAGSRDVGFSGADWVAEKEADVVELLDTGLDPVRLVAAAPAQLLESGRLPDRRLTVASEYERLASRWIAANEIDAEFVHSYGATEVFPPEDADVIVDNTATGETLAANGLTIVDELISSSTRLYASRKAIDNTSKKTSIEDLLLSLTSVLEARRRVMVELNVARQRLEDVIAILPRMRQATVASLHGDTGMAVKAAVPREDLPGLIPRLKEKGATDIVVSALAQIVP